MKILVFILFAGLIIYQFFLREEQAVQTPVLQKRAYPDKKAEPVPSVPAQPEAQVPVAPQETIPTEENYQSPQGEIETPPDVGSSAAPLKSGEMRLDPGSMKAMDQGSLMMGGGSSSDKGSQLSPSKSDKGS